MQRTPHRWIVRLSESALILVFFCALTLPAIVAFLGIDPISLPLEKRDLAPRPPAPRSLTESAAWPDAYEAFVNDRFGFRGALIRAYSHLLVLGFGVSPIEDTAVSSEPGWLFGTGFGLTEYQRERPVPEAHIIAWGEMLQTRHNWLAERGIHHILVVAPNKHSIYPEYLPQQLRPSREASCYDQLLAYLDANTDVDYIDLRPVLKEAKKDAVVYDKTGTHWNTLGAYIAAKALIEKLSLTFPELQPLPLEKYRMEMQEEPGSDLAVLLGMEQWYSETYPTPVPTWPRNDRGVPLLKGIPVWEGQPEARKPRLYVNPKGHLNVVMPRDSFGNRMIAYLNEHFESILYFPRHAFYVRTKEPHRTDLVITELVERCLLNPADQYMPPPGVKRPTVARTEP